jgi:uncharacterized protein YcfJ
MNTKTKGTMAGTAVAMLVLAHGAALADHDGPRDVYDYARVLSVQPNVRYVTVRTPVEECWNETRHYTVDRRPPGNVAGTLFGAVLGGVIGHQFGSGRGNDAATVAGVLAGAAIGSESSPYDGYETTEYARPVRRCQTRYTTHEEERIDSYRVIYAYNGRKYATDMPFDPGERIRIRVDVRPVP